MGHQSEQDILLVFKKFIFFKECLFPRNVYSRQRIRIVKKHVEHKFILLMELGFSLE